MEGLRESRRLHSPRKGCAGDEIPRVRVNAVETLVRSCSQDSRPGTRHRAANPLAVALPGSRRLSPGQPQPAIRTVAVG